MLILLSEYFSQFDPGFKVFQYLTLRGIFAAVTALAIALFLGPFFIRRLNHYQVEQIVRSDGPDTHFKKSGTPTMGGGLILVAIVFTTLLWADLNNVYIWLLLGVTISFGAVGWIDDYKKVVKRDSHGLSARWKLFWQSLFGFGAAYFLFDYGNGTTDTQLFLPFFKDFSIEMGLGFILFAYFVVVGSSNAVNLTDGLDGLAIIPAVMIASALGVISYITGNSNFSDYLHIQYVHGSGEISVFCGAIAGAGLGFLWFNTYPAQVFMGDIGALSLGAALGLVAVITRHELVFFIMAGVFVLETVSVVIQVISFKLTGRRIFRMAPIHHHYELKGWPEPRVIVRFWIITVILVLLGLATLKLR